jgi:hypothetical protein
LTPRLAEVRQKLLDVFAQRLLTIEEHKEFSPKTVAQVELKIFLENVENFTTRMQGDVTEQVRGWSDIAKQLDLQDLFQSYVASKADNAKLEMIVSAMEMAADAVSAIPGAEQFSASELTPERMTDESR